MDLHDSPSDIFTTKQTVVSLAQLLHLYSTQLILAKTEASFEYKMVQNNVESELQMFEMCTVFAKPMEHVI